MKLHALFATAALACAGAALAAEGHGHELKPLHSGVVVEVKDVEFELVARPASIQLYVRDHGKPVDVSKASAKLTLLAGADKQEVELRPAGDKLEASGSFKVGAGVKAVVVVTLPGKPVATARFALK